MLRPSLSKLVPGTLIAVLLLAAALFTTGDAPRAHAANAVTVDSAGDVGSFSSLELDGSGRPVVSHYDDSSGGLKVDHCGNATCTGGNTITLVDAPPGAGSFTSLELDGAGNPVVSYWDYLNDNLKVVHCNDANCAVGGDSITSPDTVGDVGKYSSLALDGAGQPVISYLDSTNGDLKVLHCNDANCAPGGDSITSPDTAGDVGGDISLVLDSAGNPVVSYYDYTNGNLKVLHCNDANCAPGGDSIVSPDVAGDVGAYTSLVLDGSGKPVVSYYDATNGNLRVLHCGDANCASSNTISSPDTVGNVGWNSSLALDGSGYPVVSYYGVTNHNLKVLHCGDANCNAGNTISSQDFGAGYGSSLALDGSGNPVMSYDSVGDLRVLHCTDAFCGSKISATNDAFANSTVVPGLPYIEAINTSATTTAGNDPAESCSGFGYSNSVWYTYTPPLTRNVRISTLGSYYDTVLVVYTGTKGALTEVACNDQFGGNQSQIDVQLNAGTTYHILAAQWDTVPGGGLLHFSLTYALVDGEVDTDGDGCADYLEQDTTAGFEVYGGRRDYQNSYDYFDPSHDHQVRINDIILVVQAYFKDDTDGNPGLPPYAVGYNADYDRTDDPAYDATQPWRLLAGNGLQRIDDILHEVHQYFHDCIIS